MTGDASKLRYMDLTSDAICYYYPAQGPVFAEKEREDVLQSLICFPLEAEPKMAVEALIG